MYSAHLHPCLLLHLPRFSFAGMIPLCQVSHPQLTNIWQWLCVMHDIYLLPIILFQLLWWDLAWIRVASLSFQSRLNVPKVRVVLTAHWFLICILPEGIGNEKGEISPFKLSPSVLIFSSHAMETPEVFNYLIIDAIPEYNICKSSGVSMQVGSVHVRGPFEWSIVNFLVVPSPKNGPWICYWSHAW